MSKPWDSKNEQLLVDRKTAEWKISSGKLLNQFLEAGWLRPVVAEGPRSKTLFSHDALKLAVIRLETEGYEALLRDVEEGPGA